MDEAAQRLSQRREVARVFRERLSEAMSRSKIRAAGLAARIGVDRSTLSQLLSDESVRLPRADTVAAMARELQVSLDWLLGLSSETRRGADILHESMQVAASAQTPVDAQIVRWHQEASGYKIRHVPASLPDFVKTDDVLRYEYQDFVARGPEEAIVAGNVKLENTRTLDADTEICMRLQDIRSFAAGTGIWESLGAPARREQLDRILALYDELYPSLRIFLYDGLRHYSVPYTIFGPIRAALYVGQLYFVFNTQEHIRVLSRHFDELIRSAVVQANDVPGILTDIREKIR